MMHRMKQRSRTTDTAQWRFAAAFSAVPLLLLLVLLCGTPRPRETEPAAIEMEPTAETEEAGESELPETTPASFDRTQTISVLVGEETCTMTLSRYLTGVLLAEMPASFSPEALKAQAVAARTFALKTCASNVHDGAICTDSACCQAWLDGQTLRTRLGDDYTASLACMVRAVKQTDGMVACYDGELIDAVYFSCSGGRTEDAAAVWGGEVSYLQSVESPGEEQAAHYTDLVEIPLAEFAASICAEDPTAELSGDPSCWFGAVEYTAGGGVATVCIGGAVFTGVQLRRMFGLRSTAFSIAVGPSSIAFETSGYGHRVGMSQYGADAMARAGADFEEILTHYYTGIDLIKLG